MNYEEAFKIEAFLVITDYSISAYQKTSYDSYYIWAQYITKSLRANNLGLVVKPINIITERCNEFFGFTEEIMNLYVLEFFLFEKYKDSYEIIRLIRAIHGRYVCNTKKI